jgi:EAL domain-containing protein (putative c-di-GMP-specific phosphodiesterase class I)/GGDEF domain-containing protein
MRNRRRGTSRQSAMEISNVSLRDIPAPSFMVENATGSVVSMNRAAKELFGLAGAVLTMTRLADLMGDDFEIGNRQAGCRRLTLPLRGNFDVVIADGLHATGSDATHSMVMLIPSSEELNARNNGSHVVGWDQVAEQCLTLVGPLLCVAVGVVGLEAVNSDFCRSTGDLAIAEIHRRLRLDAGEGSVVERIGGSRFLAVLPSGGDDRLAVERFLHVARQPIAAPSGDVALACCAGVSTGPSRAPRVLFDCAVRKLERAQERGAGSIEWIASSSQPRVLLARLAVPMLAAVAADEIAAAFQPVVSLISGDIVELEAFARWPAHEKVSPESMVEVARDLGILGDFRSSVLASAIDVFRRHDGSGRLWRLSINVAASELVMPSFVEAVLTQVEGAGITPSLLQLEITGAVPATELASMKCAIDALRDRGVRVALDGLRGSAVDWLALIDLDVDAIKVECDLLTSGSRAGRGGAALRSLLELAAELGIDVIAKGVETIEQHVRLLSAGCIFGQGRLYGEPQSADAVDLAVGRPSQSAWGDLTGSKRRLAIAMAIGRQLCTPG